MILDSLADGKPERYKYFQELNYISFLKLYNFKLDKAADDARQIRMKQNGGK